MAERQSMKFHSSNKSNELDIKDYTIDMIIEKGIDEIVFFKDKNPVAVINIKKLLDKYIDSDEGVKLRKSLLKYALMQES